MPKALVITLCYALIFIPLIVILMQGNLLMFVALGMGVTLGLFFYLLIKTIQADMKGRKRYAKTKRKA